LQYGGESARKLLFIRGFDRKGEETLGGCRLNLEMFNEVKLVQPANSEMCSDFLSTGLKAPAQIVS